MQPQADSGLWETFIPEIGTGALYKYHIESRHNGYKVDKADPYGFAAEIRPHTASSRVGPCRILLAATTSGWRTGRQEQRPGFADLDLRSAPRVLEAGARGRKPLAHLSGNGAATRRLRSRRGVHACRISSDYRTPLRWLLGLSDHRVLRAHQPLRNSRRLHVSGGPPASARHRRYSRLGSRAFPQRRGRPGLFRRHASLRTLPTRARASSRTGTRWSSTTAAARCKAS